MKTLLLTACIGSICMLLACGQTTEEQAASATGELTAPESGVPEATDAPEATTTPVSETVTEEAFAQMFEYYSRDDAIQIDKYLGKDANVVIPAFVGAYPVTEIEMRAFSSCDTLRSVTIPDSVTYIGGSAFDGGSDSFVIRCQAGSCAETYAKQNGMQYVLF